MRKKSQKRGKLRTLKKPLYLNANLIYGETLKLVKKKHWKQEIKTNGYLPKLKLKGYNLVTSILTRTEVMQRLMRDLNKTPNQAREAYTTIIQNNGIMEITDIHKLVPLTPALLDQIGTTKLDFKDAIHLSIAKKLGIWFCTHDKRAHDKDNWSLHPVKKRFYEHVFKPEQLIKKK